MQTSEGGDGKPPGDDAKPKRTRLRRACLNCRRTHVACNEYRPCHECQVRNLPCTDVESARPSRPEPEALPPHVSSFSRFPGTPLVQQASLPRSTSAPLSNHPYPPRPPRGITMAELKAQARMQTPIPHSISADLRPPPPQSFIPSSRTYVFIPRPPGAGNVPRTGSPGYEVSISENVGPDPVYPSPPRTPVWVEASEEGQRTRYLFHPLEGQQPTLQAPTLQLPMHHVAPQPPPVGMHTLYQAPPFALPRSPMMPHSPHLHSPHAQQQVMQPQPQPQPQAQHSPAAAALEPPVHWPHDSPEPVFTSSPFQPEAMEEDFRHS